MSRTPSCFLPSPNVSGRLSCPSTRTYPNQGVNLEACLCGVALIRDVGAEIRFADTGYLCFSALPIVSFREKQERHNGWLGHGLLVLLGYFEISIGM